MSPSNREEAEGALSLPRDCVDVLRKERSVIIYTCIQLVFTLAQSVTHTHTSDEKNPVNPDPGAH